MTVSVEYKLSRPNERRPIPFFWLLLAQSIAYRAMATPPPPRHSRSSPRPRSRLCCKHGPSEPPWCTAPPEWIDRRPACTCAELLLHDVIRACAPPGVMALSAMVEHRPPRHGRHCIVRYQVDREQFLRCLLARCSPRRIAYGCTVLMRLTWGRRALNARALCGPHAHASQGYVGHPRHAGVITLPLARLKPHSPGEAAGPSRPQRQRGGVSARKRKQAQAAASHPTRPPARDIPSSARIPPPACHGRTRHRASPCRHARSMEGRNGSGNASGTYQDTTAPAATPTDHPAWERLRTRGTPHHAQCLLRPGPPAMLQVPHARSRLPVLVAR